MTRNKFVPLAWAFAAVVWAADNSSGKLNIYMGGKPVASESYSLEKTASTLKLSGTGKADLGSMKISIDKFEVTTDEKFQPVTAEAKAQLGQLTMEDSVTFTGGKAKNEMNTGQGAKTKEDDVHADTLVVNANLPLFAWSLLAQRVKMDSTDPQTFNAYIVGQVEVPVTVTYKGQEAVEFANTKASLNHFLMNFPPGPTSQPINVDVWLDDARKIIKVRVPAQGVEAYQEGFERLAPPPATPAVK